MQTGCTEARRRGILNCAVFGLYNCSPNMLNRRQCAPSPIETDVDGRAVDSRQVAPSKDRVADSLGSLDWWCTVNFFEDVRAQPF